MVASCVVQWGKKTDLRFASVEWSTNFNRKGYLEFILAKWESERKDKEKKKVNLFFFKIFFKENTEHKDTA